SAASGCGVLQEPPEKSDAEPGVVWLHVEVTEGGHNSHPLARASDSYVEASFPAVLKERPEPIDQLTSITLAVSDGEQDGVSLVALNPFQVLHEEALVGIRTEE